MALDRNGFKRKSYNDLVNEMSAKARELYGADANVSERAVLGIIIRVMAWFLALLWQDLEDVYHSGYRKSAEGVQLDKLLPYSGITRNPADYAYGKIQITGTPHHTVESGFLVGTESDINFETVYDVTLNANGVGEVDIVCTSIGIAGNVPENTITVVVNPDANVTAVNNATETEGGREKETDSEARARAEITVDGLGSATANAVRAHLLSIPTIRAARVVENDTDDVDEFSTPAHALQTFVLGGVDEEIAEAIFAKKAGGIKAYGTTSLSIVDDSGNTQTIGFTRATEVRIYAKVSARLNSLFNDATEAEMKDRLVRYVGGVDTANTAHAGLNMGDSVIVARMVSRLFVESVEDVTVELSTDGINFSSDNINVDINEVAQLDAADVEVIEIV